jgi:recombination associated protein RdgC
MWFKNLLIYQFKASCELTHEQLEAAVKDQAFQPCQPHEQKRMGFTPMHQHEPACWVYSGKDHFYLRLTQEEKSIPAQAIQDELKDRIDAFEAKEQRSPRKKEQQRLKEDVIHQLLPRAFSRHQHTHALILPKLKLILVDASSHQRSEHLLGLLRKGLGTLPVVPIDFTQSITEVLTQWLHQGHAPAPFELMQAAELKADAAEGSSVRFKQQELDDPEVKAHLEAGKKVEHLAINFKDATQFVMYKNTAIKRVKFSSEILHTHDDHAEDPVAQMEANLQLMAGELQQLLLEFFKICPPAQPT